VRACCKSVVGATGYRRYGKPRNLRRHCALVHRVNNEEDPTCIRLGEVCRLGGVHRLNRFQFADVSSTRAFTTDATCQICMVPSREIITRKKKGGGTTLYQVAIAVGLRRVWVRLRLPHEWCPCTPLGLRQTRHGATSCTCCRELTVLKLEQMADRETGIGLMEGVWSEL
jgi:hypothetical protein